MLARIRKSMNEKEQGFTLIELLVVIIIIGILAAIAIPVFLNQRKKAVEASEKSDLRSVAVEMETYFTDAGVYPSTVPASAKVTEGNTVTVTSANSSGFCLDISSTKPVDNDWHYDSTNGGLKSGTCTA